MKKILIFSIILGMMLITVGFVIAAELNTSTIEHVPTNDGGDGGVSGMAIDSNGFIHATYTARELIRVTYTATSGNYTVTYASHSIRYCNNIVGSWNCMYIDDFEGIKGRPSIAIDSNDKIHIAYSNVSSLANGIVYCNNTVGSWSCTRILAAPGMSRASIAIDTNDKVHIARGSGNALEYCNNTVGSWSCMNIATGFDTLYNSLIVIDKNNIVHLTYTNVSDNYTLKYCNNTAGSWNCTDIEENSGSVSAPNGMALDSGDKVHLAFKNRANKDLRYCNNTVGSWSCTTIVNDGHLSGHSHGASIALDSDDKVYIFDAEPGEGYYDVNKLRYCSNLNGIFECENIPGFHPWRTPSSNIKKGLLANSVSFSNYAHLVVLSSKYTFSYINIPIFITDTTAPQFSNYQRNPTTPNEDQDVQVNVTIIETNIDTVILEFNNGTATNYTVTTSNGNEYYYTITSGNYTAHDSVTYYWYANDTAGNLNKSSQQDFIVANQIPSVSAPAINDTMPLTNDLISCDGGDFLDDDEYDSEDGREFKWYGDIEISGQTSQTLDLSVADLDKGDVIKCSVRVYDGYDNSIWTNSSNTATIQNSPPVITNPQITVSWNANGSTYNYDYDYTDADGDDETWYDNTILFDINATGYISDTPIESEAGSYVIRIDISDGEINVTDIFTYTINDVTSPLISITYPQATTYNINVTQLNYTADDDGGLDKCWWSNNSGVWNSSPQTCGTNWTGLTSNEGSNTWTVYVNDTTGNENSDSVIFTTDINITTIECGQEITENTILYNDVANCSGDGIVIGSDNITLDCAGHIISGIGLINVSGFGVKNGNGFGGEYGYDNVIIKNCNIFNFTMGISLFEVQNNTITSNNVSYNHCYGKFQCSSAGWGIIMDSSHNNTISNNFFSENRMSGIAMGNSNNNFIFNNTVASHTNMWASIDLSTNNFFNIISENTMIGNSVGIKIYNCCGNTGGSNNTISNNVFDSNGHAIWLDSGTSYNKFLNNNISDSSQHGIYIGSEGSSYNEVYHNNFINNPTQVHVSGGSGNVFDLGSEIGGNYWSDHNCTGNPSNGSEPYNFTGGVDNYPFQDSQDWIDDINYLYAFNLGQDDYNDNSTLQTTDEHTTTKSTSGGGGSSGGSSFSSDSTDFINLEDTEAKITKGVINLGIIKSDENNKGGGFLIMIPIILLILIALIVIFIVSVKKRK